MRASSLSNSKVIDLLNNHFVPVNADGVFYKANANVLAEEKAAFEQIFQDFYRLNQKNQEAGKPMLSVGTVHAYVLTPNGKPFASVHVGAATPERVLGMLKHAVAELKVPEGKPVVHPAPQAVCPCKKADVLVLHLTARYLVPREQPEARKDVDGKYVPAALKLGTARSGQWNAVPSEDWLEWDRPEWTKLLPSGKAAPGDSWDMDKQLASQLLTHFYPTTENNDLSTNRIDQQSLKGKVVSVKDGIVHARIDGSLKMKHAFYPGRDDQNFVSATIVGYVDFDQDKPRIRTLRLVTDHATYGGDSTHFGVAVRSMPALSH